MEYPYIKECSLKSSSPKATYCYGAKPGIVFCCGILCGVTGQGLQTRFQGYIMADICEATQEVSNLIVSVDVTLPVGQDRACSILNLELQTHCLEIPVGGKCI